MPAGGSGSPRQSAGYRHYKQHAVFNNFKMVIKMKRKGGGVLTTHLAPGGSSRRAGGPGGRSPRQLAGGGGSQRGSRNQQGKRGKTN